MLYRILFFVAFLIPFHWQPAAGSLVVTWVENDNVMIWTQDAPTATQIASGGANTIVLAPDGLHVAFTRGGDHRSESLWVVSQKGADEREMVSAEVIQSQMIANIAWLDASTLYFNTAQQVEVGQVLNDDLWRVDITTGDVKQIFAAGVGGNFTISPDREHIAIVRPGAYDGEDGAISIVHPLGEERRDVLTFRAVSTGSEYQFYPPITWEADSSAFHVAIPEKDLIYDDAAGMTTLWRIGVDGSQERVGMVQASFFGQPQWSFDGQEVVYLRRVGELDSNQFEMVTAAGDGSGAKAYASGEAGTLQFAGWLPGVNQFLYAQAQPGMYWIGKPDAPPEVLPDLTFSPAFVSESVYVYNTASATSFELRYADLSNPSASRLIGQSDAPILGFDAVLV